MKLFILTLLFSTNVFASAFVPVVMASGQSMTASFTTACEDMNQLPLGAIQASWTGSPVGSIDVQISNDIVPMLAEGGVNCAAITNWSDYTGSAQAITTFGNFTWNMTIAGYRYIRLSYTATSGTGTFGAIFTGKGD